MVDRECANKTATEPLNTRVVNFRYVHFLYRPCRGELRARLTRLDNDPNFIISIILPLGSASPASPPSLVRPCIPNNPNSPSAVWHFPRVGRAEPLAPSRHSRLSIFACASSRPGREKRSLARSVVIPPAQRARTSDRLGVGSISVGKTVDIEKNFLLPLPRLIG